MASHPKVLQAVRDGLRKYGLNVAASRMTTGNHEIHERLERKLANFFGVESAVLAGNGSAPNLMVAQALAGKFSHALMDERAHGCLMDAAQLLDCPVVKFKHRDPADLARVVKRLGQVRPILLTDGMFGHNGETAPLKKYLAVLPGGAVVLVDDAHGAGILGKNGRGTLEHKGVGNRQIIQTITLSKAFGVYGGAVLGTRALKAEILSRSRLFTGSTPLPTPLANAALASLAIIKADKTLRTRLRDNIAYVRDQLRQYGLPASDSPGPIIDITPRSTAETSRLKRHLLAAGIHPPFIKYPGGPVDGYFRFVISSEHTREQLNRLARTLIAALRLVK